MLGPNKRPTRVHLNGGDAGHAADERPLHPPSHPPSQHQFGNPTTPNYLQEQAAHSYTATHASANGGAARGSLSKTSWQTMKANFGQWRLGAIVTSSSNAGTADRSAAVGSISGAHCRFPRMVFLHFPSPGVKSTIACAMLLLLLLLVWRHESRPRPLPRKPLQPFDSPIPRSHDTHDHDHEAIEAVAHDTTSTGPIEPAHVHPSAFEWDHETVPERRPANFALNGEHPQYNEEKLTAIFERPRVAGLETPGLVTSFFSPSGRLKLSVLMSEEGRLGYMLDVARPDGATGASATYLPLLAPAFMELNANFQSCSFRTDNSFGAEVVWQLEFGESWWRPVPGNERRHFHETYQQVKVWCVGPQCVGCNFLWEYRLYDHALAIRAVVNGKSIEGFSLQPQEDTDAEYARLDYGMEVRLPPDTNTVCWAQSSEDPYVKMTVSVSSAANTAAKSVPNVI
jgi:hypothetical protein